MAEILFVTCEDLPNLAESDRLLAQELERLGHRTTPVVWTRGPLADARADAILIRSAWDYHLRAPDFLSWWSDAAEAIPLALNSPETVSWNVSKLYLLELAQSGVSTVPTIALPRGSRAQAARTAARALGSRRVVLKPSVSATSRLTFRLTADDPALEARASEIMAEGDLVLQPYLESVETAGEASLIFARAEDGPVPIHAILKGATPGEFRVQKEFGGSAIAFDADSGLWSFAERALECVPGDWFYARVDVMDWDVDPKIGELELIEPELFLHLAPGAARATAEILDERLRVGVGQ